MIGKMRIPWFRPASLMAIEVQGISLLEAENNLHIQGTLSLQAHQQVMIKTIMFRLGLHRMYPQSRSHPSHFLSPILQKQAIILDRDLQMDERLEMALDFVCSSAKLLPNHQPALWIEVDTQPAHPRPAWFGLIDSPPDNSPT